jgi:uncharacterized membrane protein
VVSFPGSIDVDVTGGHVLLNGPILAHEVDALIGLVNTVRGVRSVENRLEVHERPGNIPGLQGEPAKVSDKFPFMAEDWSPATRITAGLLGGVLAAFSFRKKSTFGALLGAAGLGLVARALSNLEISELSGKGDGVIEVRKSIRIAAPVDQVFEVWSRYDNFPRFMTHVKEVREAGKDLSHWKVAGPAGIPVEWDALRTHYVYNEIIGWRTVPDSAIDHSGSVRFSPDRGGGTRVDVHLSYRPGAGHVGHTVAALFGADPKSQMDDDLMRMKEFIEAGNTLAAR